MADFFRGMAAKKPAEGDSAKSPPPPDPPTEDGPAPYSAEWLASLPTMEFNIPDELRPGIEMMAQVSSMIASGAPVDTGTYQKIVRFLTELQAKADLAMVAQVPLALGRLQRLHTLTAKAEQRLENLLDVAIPLDPKELASILKVLYIERGAVQEQLFQASNKPTISSPDAMGRAMSTPAPAQTADAALPNPESRRRLGALFDQIKSRAMITAKHAQAKDTAIEVETVS